jgi:hypothetical protein
MDGTQRPINMAWISSPLKNRISEKIKERRAATKSSLSVKLNFLNMV